MENLEFKRLGRNLFSKLTSVNGKSPHNPYKEHYFSHQRAHVDQFAFEFADQKRLKCDTRFATI
jgi:hypothetical protein